MWTPPIYRCIFSVYNFIMYGIWLQLLKQPYKCVTTSTPGRRTSWELLSVTSCSVQPRVAEILPPSDDAPHTHQGTRLLLPHWNTTEYQRHSNSLLKCVECGQSVYMDCTILWIWKVVAVKYSCCHHGLISGCSGLLLHLKKHPVLNQGQVYCLLLYDMTHRPPETHSYCLYAIHWYFSPECTYSYCSYHMYTFVSNCSCNIVARRRQWLSWSVLHDRVVAIADDATAKVMMAAVYTQQLMPYTPT